MAASSPTRRTYLVGRLVNKQITMEEATELFTILMRENDMLRRDLMATAQAAPARAARAPGTSPAKPAPAPPPGALANANIEDVLLFGAPMIAILAALLKKSGLDQMGPPSPTKGQDAGPAKKSGT